MKKDLVQVKNPRSKQYVKIDRDKGEIIGHSNKPYKGIKIASRKQKGRELQKLVGRKISEAINLPFGTDCPIESRPMGCQGTDLRLDSTALKLFKYSVECKCQETFSIPAWIEQAKANQIEGTDWLLVCGKNRFKPIVVLDLDAFFELFTKAQG